MKSFFEALWDARGGIFVFVVCVVVLLVALAWFLRNVASTLHWGKFRPTAQSDSQAPTLAKVPYIVANLFVKLITDFRHLLALLLVLIFAGVLIYAIYTVGPGDGDGLSKALQAVMSTLGGLVGSIVGYYFGESAGLRTGNLITSGPGEGGEDAEQNAPGAGGPSGSSSSAAASATLPSITPAPPPAGVPAPPANPSSPTAGG